MSAHGSLFDEVRGLVRRGIDVFEGTARAERLHAVAERMDAPLRVAIAGRVKSGKSTLLNALVGEELAATDAGECTKIVTWYREGRRYRVLLEPPDGPAIDAPFTRDGGAIEVDLGSRTADEVARLVVEWPSAALRDLTLIDTPGIASLATEVSDRTRAFLTREEHDPTAADAVVYLMRHAHASDVRFLEAFHDEEVSRATPVNAVGVLSRADELGAGKPDSLESARRIAERYRTDPKLRRLVQTVVPVSGLLAETGATLLEDEYRAVGRLAEAPTDEVERLLLTADRFADRDTAVPLDPGVRRHLLERFGIFGLRLAVEIVREGATTATRLADGLLRHSGLEELRSVLASRFADRAGLLKARSALLAVGALLPRLEDPAVEGLHAELERIEAGAHELAELRLLNDLRAGRLPLRAEELDEAERLLGGSGPNAPARLGLVAGAEDEDVRGALLDAVARWRARGESPVTSRDAAEACRILVRTCEGMIPIRGSREGAIG